MTDLFTPFDLAGLRLPNRIVMPPLTRSRGPEDAATEQVALYYTQRATAGLIVAEGSPISNEGQGYLHNPGIFTRAQVEGWRLVTDSVHAAGGRMFLQVWHVGRISHTSIQEGGRAPVSATGRTAEGSMAFGRNERGEPDFVAVSKPRALGTDEVGRVVTDFARAARNAMEAGFDGVELHAANGYLFDQFLNPLINDRTDRYSAATLEGRLRFTLEVVDAVADAVGPGRVGIRLTPYGTINSVPPFDETEDTFAELGRELGRRRIAYIHVMDQTGFFNTPEGQKPTSEAIHGLLGRWRRDAPGVALMLDGGLTKARATKFLADGLIDLAGFGQPFIANPDLVARLRNDWPLTKADRRPSTPAAPRATSITHRTVRRPPPRPPETTRNPFSDTSSIPGASDAAL
ncbi:alkene reductase [Chenggangzhangella methanolivorans]|uniref:alkene reductase n=1 Tax=Chenggangzhangella methanolivorans TaxID=1437009 RepID=UPI0021BDB38E|nr:alkene reductase [Chenggangzhangella methanolivorans]